MIWIYFILFFFHATTALKLIDYNKEPLFNDNLCLSSAVQLTGVFPGWLSCGTACVRSDGCRSFFYNSVSLECFSVNAVLTSREGCETRSGTSYFLRQCKIHVSKSLPTFKQKTFDLYDYFVAFINELYEIQFD